eukprot:Amastigsp_a180768_7.p4 type:complete len:102 gc:universal Amastigsp_a180768_7:939-634(-)
MLRHATRSSKRRASFRATFGRPPVSKAFSEPAPRSSSVAPAATFALPPWSGRSRLTPDARAPGGLSTRTLPRRTSSSTERRSRRSAICRRLFAGRPWLRLQ